MLTEFTDSLPAGPVTKCFTILITWLLPVVFGTSVLPVSETLLAPVPPHAVFVWSPLRLSLLCVAISVCSASTALSLKRWYLLRFQSRCSPCVIILTSCMLCAGDSRIVIANRDFPCELHIISTTNSRYLSQSKTSSSSYLGLDSLLF